MCWRAHDTAASSRVDRAVDLRRNQAERDLQDELDAFVAMAAADEIHEGATRAEALRRAAVQLGGIEQAKERVRSARHGAWLDAAGRDARYGLRQVRRNPAFSAIAIATLALGIGGTTAMFGIFDAVLVRRCLPRCGPS